MKLDDLNYFFTVAKAHSTSIAAEQLHISQPAISIAIKRLEQELGIPLFTRAYRGVSLTSAGEEIYQQIPVLLDTIEHIQAIAQKYQTACQPDIENPPMTIVKMNIQEAIATAFPDEVVTSACLNNIIPQITTPFNLVNNIASVLPFADNDIALFYLNTKNYNVTEIPDNYVVEVLATSKIYFIVSRNNINFLTKNNISYDEIINFPLIYPHNINNINNIGAQLYAPLFTHGTPNIVMHCEKIDSIPNIIANTNYGAILFKFFKDPASSLESNLRYIQINDNDKYLMCAIYKKGHPNINSIRFVISALKKYV